MTHIHSLTLSLSLSHTHTHTLSLSHSHTRAHNSMLQLPPLLFVSMCREIALRTELQRQERLLQLSKTFHRKAERREEWITDTLDKCVHAHTCHTYATDSLSFTLTLALTLALTLICLVSGLLRKRLARPSLRFWCVPKLGRVSAPSSACAFICSPPTLFLPLLSHYFSLNLARRPRKRKRT